MNITILGAGAYGQALAYLARKNHHQVAFYDKKSPAPTLLEALKDTNAIILAIPSTAIPATLAEIPTSYRETPLILASKGLFSLEIFQDFPNFSVISGPGFSEDIVADKPTTLTATSELIKSLFTTKELNIELTTDSLGVTICGPLNNIYAIGGGFLAGRQSEQAPIASDKRHPQPLRGPSDEPRKDGSEERPLDDDNGSALHNYLQSTLAEMKLALKIIGANPATADLACGLGELNLKLITDTGRSRNFQLGQQIASGKSPDPKSQTLEGLTALQNLPTKLKSLPLLDTISKIVQLAEIKTTKTEAAKTNDREKQ